MPQPEHPRVSERIPLPVDRLPLACILLDTDHRVLDWNAAATQTFGYTREEALGRVCLDLILAQPLDEQIQEILRRVASGDMHAHSVNENRTKDGRIITCAWINTPLLDAGGRFVGVIGLAEDVTERKRAQAELDLQKDRARFQLAELEQIYRYAPVGLAFLDRDLRFVRINEELAAANGKTVAEHIGRTVREILPELADTLEPLMHRAISSGEPVIDVEVHGVTPAEPDVARDWLVSYCPLKSAEGIVLGVVPAVVEITQRKRAEEKLRDYSESVQALSRQLLTVQEEERRHLARELHDEIGQSLTSLQFILDAGPDLSADELRSRLHDARVAVAGLLAKVRELSFDLRPAALDHLGLLPALLWLIERFSAQTRVQVHFRHEGLSVRFGQPTETTAYRLVQEALTNVARHAGVNEVEIRIWVQGSMLHVQVEDEGAGFDPAMVLVSPATCGLTGLRERVELLGGRLTIDSAVGEGTNLLAQLPFPP